MKALLLPEKKEFMNLLLRSEIFDNFLVSEASVHTIVKYDIDGHINKNFYTEQEMTHKKLEGLEYLPYGQLRPFCYSLIKGRHTPSYFKFILMLSPSNMKNTLQASGTLLAPEDISAIFLNILYQNQQLMLTTGVSYQTFIPDKSFDKEWDKFAISFLKKNGIIFSEI